MDGEELSYQELVRLATIERARIATSVMGGLAGSGVHTPESAAREAVRWADALLALLAELDSTS